MFRVRWVPLAGEAMVREGWRAVATRERKGTNQLSRKAIPHPTTKRLIQTVPRTPPTLRPVITVNNPSKTIPTP